MKRRLIRSRAMGNDWQRVYTRSDGARVVISRLTVPERDRRFEVEVTASNHTSLHYRRTRRAARRVARSVRFA